jgi:uncharacterized repeat protein (TIGR01451 family)
MTAQVTAVPIQAVHAILTAMAGYIDLDRNPSNDVVSADSPIAEGALDLSLTLSVDRSPITTGENAVFHMKVANSGPLASPSHFVTMTLPPLFDLVSATSPCSRTNSTTVTCAYSPLAAGGIEEATLTLHPTRVGTGTVTASVPTSTSETRTDNNTASASVVVLAMADMSITLNASPTAVQTGDAVTYTITAKNVADAAAASNVVVNLDLPPSLAFVSASPQCSGGASVTCSAGTLAGGTPATFTVIARALQAGTIKALASVSTASEESNNGNNTAAATVVISAPSAPPAPSRRRAARH